MMVAEATVDSRRRTSGTPDLGDPEVCLSLEGQEDRDRREEIPGGHRLLVVREQSPATGCEASGRVLCFRPLQAGRGTGSGG